MPCTSQVLVASAARKCQVSQVVRGLLVANTSHRAALDVSRVCKLCGKSTQIFSSEQVKNVHVRLEIEGELHDNPEGWGCVCQSFAAVAFRFSFHAGMPRLIDINLRLEFALVVHPVTMVHRVTLPILS